MFRVIVLDNFVYLSDSAVDYDVQQTASLYKIATFYFTNTAGGLVHYRCS